MANIAKAIIQGGLGLQAAQDYDEQQAGRAHLKRIREHGVKVVGSDERRMAADDSLLDQQTAEKRATLADQGRSREHQEAYRQLVSGGASFDTLAEEARKRGDLSSEKAFRDAKSNSKREGLNDLVTSALTGADDIELERIYNSGGRDRVDPGSMKLDRKTGILSFSKNGKPSAVSMSQAGELLGILKRPEMKQTTVAPGAQLAVDGRIVATNTAGIEAQSAADYKRGEVAINPETGQPFYKYPAAAAGLRGGAPAPGGGAAAAAAGIQPPGGVPPQLGAPGAPGARPPRKIETHEDQRVKQVDSQIRFYLTGSNTFATMDPKTQAKYDKLMGNAGQKVRAGMNPEAAATAAINEVNHEEAALAAAGRPGGGAAYSGPAPWRR